jgi:hypothetical protein
VFNHIYIFVAALIMADDVTDTVETGRYHSFRHRYFSAIFWEEERGNFNGDGLFHHGVMIGDRCAITTIDHISTINLISIEVVETLHLATRASTAPYLNSSRLNPDANATALKPCRIFTTPHTCARSR